MRLQRSGGIPAPHIRVGTRRVTPARPPDPTKTAGLDVRCARFGMMRPQGLLPPTRLGVTSGWPHRRLVSPWGLRVPTAAASAGVTVVGGDTKDMRTAESCDGKAAPSPRGRFTSAVTSPPTELAAKIAIHALGRAQVGLGTSPCRLAFPLSLIHI